MEKIVSLSVNQIDEYMQALVSNARELLRESELLYKKKANARSYTLSHIAREEIAKCKILYAAGRRLIAGMDVDWKVTFKRLRSHKSKLKQEIVANAATMLLEGYEDGFDVAMNVVSESSDMRNDYKNNSLYVGISMEGEIIRPDKVVNQDLAQRNIQLARFALNDEVNFQSRVGKLSKMDPEKMPDITSVDAKSSLGEYKEVLKKASVKYKNHNKK